MSEAKGGGATIDPTIRTVLARLALFSPQDAWEFTATLWRYRQAERPSDRAEEAERIQGIWDTAAMRACPLTRGDDHERSEGEGH